MRLLTAQLFTANCAIVAVNKGILQLLARLDVFKLNATFSLLCHKRATDIFRTPRFRVDRSVPCHPRQVREDDDIGDGSDIDERGPSCDRKSG